MTVLSIPPQLANPVMIAGKVGAKVMLDVTVYLGGPLEQELEFLVDFYSSICPADRLSKFTIAEFEYWSTIANPQLTASGREAAAAGIKRPYLEPVRRRIRDGRAFEVQFWDGRPIDDPEGSWSFNCQRIHLRSSGLHAFARILVPLQTDTEILRTAALAIANNLEFYSGHAGLAFVFDAWLEEDALDAIYALARRYWGVDVEDLNDTLPLMKEHIKCINWITMLGRQFMSEPDVEAALENLSASRELTLERCQHGCVIRAGPSPAVGDQHQLEGDIDPYVQVADAVSALLLDEHPDFPGQRFIDSGSTVGWIRRFIEPDGWR